MHGYDGRKAWYSVARVQAYGVATRTGGPPELVVEYCDQPNWGPHYFKPR